PSCQKICLTMEGLTLQSAYRQKRLASGFLFLPDRKPFVRQPARRRAAEFHTELLRSSCGILDPIRPSWNTSGATWVRTGGLASRWFSQQRSVAGLSTEVDDG